MDSVFQYYKGLNSQKPQDEIGALLWSAEQMFAEERGGGELLELQHWVCAMVTKWVPYSASDYLRVYLRDSPYKELLARIYEIEICG